MIDRLIFIKLCTNAIKKTQKDIAIVNQIKGYYKYHKELKENNYLSTARDLVDDIIKDEGYWLPTIHSILKYTKMGHCRELAEYLSSEVIIALQAHGATAEVYIVKSRKQDHGFVHVLITLKNEIETIWEIDAWRPRIIDITKRPNGTIKNKKLLKYGEGPKVLHIINTTNFKEEAERPLGFFHDTLHAPLPGLLGDATPPREVKKKRKLHSDHTIEKAIEEGLLDDFEKDNSKIGYPRKVSKWQKKPI